MTPSELKYQYEQANPDGYFFTRKTMKFFGDTMANYGVINHPNGYELFRRKPVNMGLAKSAYFTKEFKQTSIEGIK